MTAYFIPRIKQITEIMYKYFHTEELSPNRCEIFPVRNQTRKYKWGQHNACRGLWTATWRQAVIWTDDIPAHWRIDTQVSMSVTITVLSISSGGSQVDSI